MLTKRFLSLVLALMTALSVLLGTVTVTAEETSPYRDVKPKRWSYADIKYVSENGLMNGTGEGIFAPAETMTRAMVVTVFYRLAGSPTVEYVPTFTDVKAGKWFTDAIIWASSNGIVNGTGDGKYEPMTNVTREQLAAIIMRYAQFDYIKTDKTVDITGYADYKRIHDYAREAMAWANAAGLITGKTESTLAPREGATREQFAAILHRFDTAEFGYELVYNAPVYGQNYVEPSYELVEDADIYVAVDGDDTNPGTLDKPVKTFHRARDMVREMDKTGRDGITVAFKAGDYGALEEVIFNSEDSGTAECPITYCAYGDGDVIFRNGIEISEKSFVPITDEEAKLFPEEAVKHIFKADISDITLPKGEFVLFGGNGACEEARWPNSDAKMPEYKDCTTRVEEEGKEEREYDKLQVQYYLVNQVNGFSTYDGLKITGHLRTGWFKDTFPVKSYDRETSILTLDFENYEFDDGWTTVEYPLAYEERMEDTVYFQNLAEFLDNKGEYWVDGKAENLYVYAPEGDYAIPTGGPFMFIYYGVGHLNFVGLEFNGTSDTAIAAFGTNLTFDRCTFGNVSGESVLRLNDATDITITNNEFYNFVRGGVNLSPNVFEYGLQHGNNVITNNYFHDFGQPHYFEGSGAICVYDDVGTYIAHNEFVNGAHAGVEFNVCIDLVIEYNVFDNMMATTSDYGAVYSYIMDLTHRGNIIRYNLFTNIRDKGAQHGVYLDGACGNEVYGNLFHNSGSFAVTFNGGRDNNVHDNIIVNTCSRNTIAYIGGIQNVTDSDDPYAAAIRYLSYKPEKGDYGYEEWYKRWPILYEYTFDMDALGDHNCLYTPVNTLTNNKTVGGSFKLSEAYDLYAVKEGMEEFELTANPYFANPTKGDYTIINTDGLTEIFDFGAVGRK